MTFREETESSTGVNVFKAVNLKVLVCIQGDFLPAKDNVMLG